MYTEEHMCGMLGCKENEKHGSGGKQVGKLVLSFDMQQIRFLSK
jgi:hypothetical protein